VGLESTIKENTVIFCSTEESEDAEKNARLYIKKHGLCKKEISLRKTPSIVYVITKKEIVLHG